MIEVFTPAFLARRAAASRKNRGKCYAVSGVEFIVRPQINLNRRTFFGTLAGPLGRVVAHTQRLHPPHLFLPVDLAGGLRLARSFC